jgi:hypothetical protein
MDKMSGVEPLRIASHKWGGAPYGRAGGKPMRNADADAMAICAEALKRTDPAARTGYLDGACADDAALCSQVKELIAVNGGAGRDTEDDSSSNFVAASSPQFEATSTSTSIEVARHASDTFHGS